MTKNIEIIYTYDDRPQEFQMMNLVDSSVLTEENFLIAVFTSLGKDFGEHLIKLSLCHYTQTDDEESITWLMNRNGKFFFNININKDSDTLKWYNFKQNFYNSNLATSRL